MDCKGDTRKLWGDENVLDFDYAGGYVGGGHMGLHLSNLINLYTSDGSILLYVNYPSLKLIKRK